MSGYSYILDEDIAEVRTKALDAAKAAPDDLWIFCHSIMIGIVEAQGGTHQDFRVHGHCDGFFDMPNGEFDVSAAATRLQIALEARDKFLTERTARR